MIPETSVYNDFKGLNELEAGARERTPEATREAARQFEALFVQMMLKSMREAGSVFAEDRDTTYEEMFDQQIALELTREKGLGLAEMLVRQLGGTMSPESALPIDQSRLRERMDERLPSSPVPDADAATPAASPVPERRDFRPDGPESFLRKIWPMAEQAAKQLGVDVRAIAAQAALETGWGQRLIRDAEGISGNNLFGIKADGRWDGERVSISTLEYDNGVAKREHAEFRAYPDLESGFEDYVNFLRENPRYSDATRGNLSASDYALSLQTAGYATDPKYASKISNIMDSPRFSRVVDDLKTGSESPTRL